MSSGPLAGAVIDRVRRSRCLQLALKHRELAVAWLQQASICGRATLVNKPSFPPVTLDKNFLHWICILNWNRFHGASRRTIRGGGQVGIHFWQSLAQELNRLKCPPQATLVVME